MLHRLPLVLLLALGCARSGPPAMMDLGVPQGRMRQPLEALLAEPLLRPGDASAVQELGRDAHTSQHLVWIRDGEEPHRHDRHDLLVVILRGHGRMLLGADERPVGEGSIVYVPRGRVHAFRNDSPEPAAAYAVYVPPYDGADRVRVPVPGPAGP